MPKIFISYRRDDSEFVADAIYNEMKTHFGDGNVFIDVGEIPFGVDFRTYLRDQIDAHDVVLVLIGPKWADIMQARATQDSDFVRIEIENALRLNKLIIPVLVMKLEQMPDFSVLPASIRDLQWRNGAKIRREPDFRPDCKRVVDNINQMLNVTVQPPPPPTPTKNPLEASEDAVRAIIGDPFAWCAVPAGEFIMGSDDHYDDEKPRRTLNLDYDFAIAKYPITYSQFERFIQAKDGFKDARWWVGLTDEQPKQTGEQELKIDNHPRENVSWYDAIAFCRWLSFRRSGVFDVDKVDQWVVRLPTEFEWEKAARGTNGLEYPYGNEFDAQKCNTKESGIGQTTPVTAYPQGASPYGALNMSGNVWEWCLSAYNEPQVLVRDENMRSEISRCLRGGSWINLRVSARTSLRFVGLPLKWLDFRGFRLVMSSPI